MRRVDYLITKVRELTKNTRSTTTTGKQDEEFLEYFNRAQDRLQSLISANKDTGKIFVTYEELDVVGNQDEYSLINRVFMNKAVHGVWYSRTGNLADYCRLDKVNLINKDTNPDSYIKAYYRRYGKVYLVPTPSSNQGKIRVYHERELDDLDKRRGTITTVNGLTSTTFTSIVLDTDADETSNINLSNIDYICIVDKDGNRKAYNIPVGTYDTGTNTLTPVAGFVFEKDGDAIAIGDYVVFNKNTTTTSQLPDACERYLLAYCEEMISNSDSKQNMGIISAALKEIEVDIIKAIASTTSEIDYVPQVEFPIYG